MICCKHDGSSCSCENMELHDVRMWIVCRRKNREINFFIDQSLVEFLWLAGDRLDRDLGILLSERGENFSQILLDRIVKHSDPQHALHADLFLLEIRNVVIIEPYHFLECFDSFLAVFGQFNLMGVSPDQTRPQFLFHQIDMLA